MGLISSLDCSGKPEVCRPMSETLTYCVHWRVAGRTWNEKRVYRWKEGLRLAPFLLKNILFVCGIFKHHRDAFRYYKRYFLYTIRKIEFRMCHYNTVL